MLVCNHFKDQVLHFPLNEMMTFSQSACIHISPCFTEAEVRALAKERQKKDNHNLSKSTESVFIAHSHRDSFDTYF